MRLLARYIDWKEGGPKTPPSILLFGGFKYSFAIGFTLHGVMTLENENGKSYTLVGAYRHSGGGIGMCIWPFDFWVLW